MSVLTDLRNRSRDIHMVETTIVPRMTDDTSTDTTEYRNILAAVKRYNRDRPYRASVFVPTRGGATSSYILTDLVPGWDNDTYRIADIQVDLTSNYETFYHRNDWRQSRDTATREPAIRLVRGGLSENFIVWYTRPHIFESDWTRPDHCTLPSDDEEAIAHLVAFFALKEAANFYARKAQNINYSADTVDYRRLTTAMRDRANEEEAYYEGNIKELPPGPEAGFVTWETGPSSGGSWLLHGRYSRGWP